MENNNERIKEEFIFETGERGENKILSPPLARSESFYDGSISDIQQKGAVPDNLTSLSQENSEGEDDKKTSNVAFSISRFVDTWFWFNPSLLFLLLSRFLGHASMVLFFMFLPSLLLECGYSLGEASLVLTSISITNTVSRILFGALMDCPKVSPALLTALGFILQALLQFIIPFNNNYILFVLFGVMFGIVQAPYNIGLSIILGEMLPTEKLASAFAKMAFLQGAGAIVGPCVAGFIYDTTNNVQILFFLAAIISVISGLSCGMSAYLFNKTKLKT